MSLAKLGGAKRVLVSERDIQEREDLDEDEVDEHVEEHSKTPTAQSVRRNFDFDAPQHHDFNQDDTFTADSWFGNLMPIIDAEHKDSPDQGFGNIFDHLNEKPTSSIREFVDNNKSRRDSVHSMITQIRRRKSGRKITVPKPFHLLTNGGGVSKKVAVASPFVPLAVKLQKIQTDTPERFHKKPKVGFD